MFPSTMEFSDSEAREVALKSDVLQVEEDKRVLV
jgi:hypothetical protein